MLIRTYEDRDRERVEEICVITDNSHLERNLLFTLYCHYYIDYEKENCFVAEEDGKVVGYIISAKDNKVWKDRFTSILDSSTPEIREKGLESISGSSLLSRIPCSSPYRYRSGLPKNGNRP